MAEYFLIIRKDAAAIIVALGCIIFACLWAKRRSDNNKSSQRTLAYIAALAYTLAQAVVVLAYCQSYRWLVLMEIGVSFIVSFWAYCFKKQNEAMWVLIVSFYAGIITMVV